MKTLVLGASGATGKHLVDQLLQMNQKVKVIVRPSSIIPDDWMNNNKLSVIKGNISEMSEDEMIAHLNDCDKIASCLGHNLTRKGIWGKPRRLVCNAVKLACNAVEKIEPEKPIKFVLMNTTGNWNRDLNEPMSFGEKLVIGLSRTLVPPQADNEQAAEFLRVNIGQTNKFIEWTAIRPDTLINAEAVSKYELHPSPTQSAVFKAGQTSRINVGNFMARLIVESDLWTIWKGQMPVIYNTKE